MARTRDAQYDLLCRVFDHDFLPTFASILNAKLPAVRPIDGVDQTAVFLGKSEMGNRESLLSFVGPDLVALRWKRWRIY